MFTLARGMPWCLLDVCDTAVASRYVQHHYCAVVHVVHDIVVVRDAVVAVVVIG